jgi:hypothetical protein
MAVDLRLWSRLQAVAGNSVPGKFRLTPELQASGKKICRKVL